MINNLAATSHTRRAYDHRIREQVIRIGTRCLPCGSSWRTWAPTVQAKNARTQRMRLEWLIDLNRFQFGVQSFIFAAGLTNPAEIALARSASPAGISDS